MHSHFLSFGFLYMVITCENPYLAVRDGLLREIIVEDNGVLAVVTEVLPDSGTRVRRQELTRHHDTSTNAQHRLQ